MHFITCLEVHSQSKSGAQHDFKTCRTSCTTLALSLGEESIPTSMLSLNWHMETRPHLVCQTTHPSSEISDLPNLRNSCRPCYAPHTE